MGRYNSASEVVREALHLMEERNELRALQLERLRREIREGLESGPPPLERGRSEAARPQARRLPHSRRLIGGSDS